MLLLDKYFQIESTTHYGSGHVLFHVRLMPGCDVYRGHFPGNPVSPGVCNIGMIRECFVLLLDDKPRIKTIERCRLTAIASPAVCPELDVEMTWTKDDDGWHLEATIRDDKHQYMDFKGLLS